MGRLSRHRCRCHCPCDGWRKSPAMVNADVVAGRVRPATMVLPRSNVSACSTASRYYSLSSSGIPETVFREIDGFDPGSRKRRRWLNYRGGCRLSHGLPPHGHRLSQCQVDFSGFKQSFWYGFGRKEPTYGMEIVDLLQPSDMVKVSKEENIWKLLRLLFSFLRLPVLQNRGKRQIAKERWRKSKVRTLRISQSTKFFLDRCIFLRI